MTVSVIILSVRKITRFYGTGFEDRLRVGISSDVRSKRRLEGLSFPQHKEVVSFF